MSVSTRPLRGVVTLDAGLACPAGLGGAGDRCWNSLRAWTDLTAQ
jgi:hypothetical protein